MSDQPTERIEHGRRIFEYRPATVEQMLSACNSLLPNKEVIPTEAFMRDLCARLLTLEEARRG